jgi:hypothetical protein
MCQPSTRPRRDRRRQRCRRALASLATIGALAALMQITGAAPANADCYAVPGPTGIDYQCDIDGGESGGAAGGGGGGGIHRPLLDTGAEGRGGGGGGQDGYANLDHLKIPEAARDAVNRALAKEACRNLLSSDLNVITPGPDHDARETWGSVKITKSPTPSADDPNAAAQVPTSQAGSGQGEIILFPRFDHITGPDINSIIPEGKITSPTMTADDVKALVVLHELAHLDGGLGDDTSSLGISSKATKEFNARVLTACLGVNVL